jgi:hypothetical protein
MVVEIGAFGASMFFAIARPIQALVVLADISQRDAARQAAEEAGISLQFRFASCLTTTGPVNTPFLRQLADADDYSAMLDTFGIEQPVSLILLAVGSADCAVAEAISPTLLQRDAPAICLEGDKALAGMIGKRLARFGYRSHLLAEAAWLFTRDVLPSTGQAANLCLESRLVADTVPATEPVALRVQTPPEPASPQAGQTEALAQNTAVPPTTISVPSTLAVHIANATSDHLFWGPKQIATWRADGKIERLADDGTVFAASGKLHIASNSFAVEPDFFYTLALCGRMLSCSGLVRVLVMDDTIDIPVVCREVRLAAGSKMRIAAEFRALHRSSTLHIRIEVPQAKPGDQFALAQMQVSRIGATKALAQLEVDLGSDLPIASMASVVGRDEMMLDAVSTLYRQCAKLRVYLNRHTDLPSYLDDPRIEVAWSSDHGDMGDTGKFFWAEDTTPGPRLVVDDDFIFPTDFTQHMVGKLKHYDCRAMIGVHGIILRQPLLKSYYDPTARFVNRYVIGLGSDLPVHTVGTGAVCYDPAKFRLALRDFPFNNMADIWVMLAAQRQNIPIIAASRPYHWLIDNRTTAPSESIFKASSSDTKNSFNTAKMQSHVTRVGWPISIQRRISAGVAIRKALLLLEALSSADACMAAIRAWWDTRPRWLDWVVVAVTPDEQTEMALHDLLAQANLPCEFQIVGTTALKRKVTVADLVVMLRAIDYDVAVRFAPGIRPVGKTWHPILAEAEKAGLVELHSKGKMTEPPVMAWTRDTLTGLLAKASNSDPGNWVDVLRGIADACKLRSVSRLAVEDTIVFEGGAGLAGVLEGVLRTSTQAGRLRCDMRPVWLNYPGTIRINDVAERVFLLNLDRRPDRLAMFTAQAEKIGLKFERFSAFDGSKEPHFSEWQTYSQQPVMPFPKGVGPFKWEWDLYNSYLSDNHRIAHYEHKHGKKIMSKGAWGYQKSMIEIIGRAIENDWDSVLIFDDDCLFHRETVRLFDQRMREVPPDWMMLNLGALQYSWESKWINWKSNGLYHCRGSSVGSHAVLLHREAYPLVMMAAMRMDLPFDTGALHSVKRKHADRCFVFFPNLFIQNVDDSDIGDSNVQLREGGQADNKYRWILEDYTTPHSPGQPA